MVPRRSRRSLVLLLLVFFLIGIGRSRAYAQSTSTAGELRAYSTIYSVGVEWDVLGDNDHDARATLEYRQQGASTWVAALPLVRVDFNGANMLAGSILFLTPQTSYDLRVTLIDPDGGGVTRTTSVATRKLPALPVGGRVLHVAPGSGGGDGSAGNPFRGIAAAQAVARAGDTFLLHGGWYGGRIDFNRPGNASDYLVWKGAGDGEVLMDGINIAASHIWLEGITIRNQAFATLSENAPTNVVVRRCAFYNNHYSVYLQQGGTYWYIADNTIVGDMPSYTESFDGEGIELNSSSGHTVAHNSITNTADGISYPVTNVDMFGNDIFDTSDDGIEIDGGGTNVRIWGNRIHNAAHNSISFQPQTGSPSYIVRNQIVGFIEAPFKFRTTDRFVLLHNTIVGWGSAWWGDAFMCCNDTDLLRVISRNNLWINMNNSTIWNFGWATPTWETDLDYDGFDWSSASVPFTYGGLPRATLGAFAAASGLEQHGRQISRFSCFETFSFPSAPPSPVPAQAMTLNASCPAVDGGAVLPNINNTSYVGGAPDMGAYERGAPVQTYGPREGDQEGGGGPITPPPTAHLVPGTIQAEDFDDAWDATSVNSGGQYRSTPVDIELTADAGGGYNVGWIDSGEWLDFNLDVQAAGTYQVAARVASIYGHATVSALVDGVPVGGAVSVPNTGSWQAWQTITSSGVTLSAGIHRLRLTTGTGAFNLNWLTVNAASTPATGRPVPGVVEAEDFDDGAFWDSTAENYGGQYRSTPVDIEATTDTGGGYNVGWFDAGEWLEYTINVQSAGSYQISARVASPYPWSTVTVVVDGSNVGSALAVPNTGWWQTWQTVTSQAVSLSAGVHALRIYTGTGGLNVNNLTVTSGAVGHAVPGTIEAEDFDEGAFWDSTAENRGGQYRNTAVDIEATADSGGGYNIGWMDPGEWLEYTIQVQSAGVYPISVRVAALSGGSTLTVSIDGAQVGSVLSVPNSGGWQNWRTIQTSGVFLSAGVHRLRLYTGTGAMNVNKITF